MAYLSGASHVWFWVRGTGMCGYNRGNFSTPSAAIRLVNSLLSIRPGCRIPQKHPVYKTCRSRTECQKVLTGSPQFRNRIHAESSIKDLPGHRILVNDRLPVNSAIRTCANILSLWLGGFRTSSFYPYFFPCFLHYKLHPSAFLSMEHISWMAGCTAARAYTSDEYPSHSAENIPEFPRRIFFPSWYQR